jgi:hypothetical protein
MTRPFERVYTVNEYYDGPRAGFADFDGVPHAYVSQWNAELDDWDEFFTLRPVSADLLALALEDWAIWARWERAYRAGETTQTTHPALPADAERLAILEPIIEQALTFEPPDGFSATAEFRLLNDVIPPASVPSSERRLEVLWTPRATSGVPAV